MDDILIHGKDQAQHDTRLKAVLQRLQEAGLTLNSEKCRFSQSCVKFLGHLVDQEGIHPDPDKVVAIVQVQPPSDVSAVRRFLGMANQMSKFCPNLADKTKPLRELLNKSNEWTWGEAQQRAFEDIKTSLSSEPILALYDPNNETTVAADASAYGLGAVILQKQSTHEWKPVAYVSRAMMPTEQRYPQIEKEALALTWACERFADYLLGLEFNIQTDHKPLVPLFSTKCLEELPLRIQRFRMHLMRFQFTISHVPGKNLTTADALSQVPVSKPTKDDEIQHKEGEAFIQLVFQSLPASEPQLQKIKTCQEKDKVCKQITTYCSTGWPHKNKLSQRIKLYHPMAAEFTVVNGLLMRGSRIVIPSSMRSEMLEKLHRGHQGVTKCREWARQSIWWPGLSKQLEELVKNCKECCRHQSQRAEPLVPSVLPSLPWQKVAVDLFEWRKHMYLLLIDYYSR